MTLPHKIVPALFLEKKKQDYKKEKQNQWQFKQNEGGAGPFFLLDFLQYQHMLSSVNSIQTAKNFLCTVSIQKPNFFQPMFYKLFVERWVLDIFLFLYVPLPS